MKKLIVIFLLLLTGSLTGISAELGEYFRILPVPQKIELTGGTGLFYSDLKFLIVETHGSASPDSASQTPMPVLGNLTAALPQTAKKGSGIHLQMTQSADLPDSDEGYILEVKDNGVYIKAKSQKGLFYACQTLEQLMEDSRDNEVRIPCMKITDYPEIDYRGIHLDLKHHLDGINYYYGIIDRLAKIKINAIIVEFEDKLRYRKEPVVGAAHAISIEEFAAISNYAKQRNIEISPLVQGLGHASFILKHEIYKPLRDDPASDWVFDPLNPETYKVQFALYEDAMAATPNGKYLHIGGDEVGDLGKSKLCKESGKTPFELQMYWLKKVTEFAQAHNRIPIFWDDMVFKLSGLYNTTYEKMDEQLVRDLWKKNKSILDKSLSLFPANCVYNRWSYDYPKLLGNQLAIDWFKENNLSVMAATAAQQMAAMIPRNSSNFQSIKDFCQITSEKRMSGILCTIWDDSSPHFESVWRGLYDFALFSWNYEDIQKETAHEIYRHRFYAPELSPATFDFHDLLEQGASFWDNALVTKGYRAKYIPSYKLIDLPLATDNSDWAGKYSDKLNKAKNAVSRYNTIKNQLVKAASLARRNNYSLAVFNQMNELQVYPSNLLLLLEQYAKAPQSGKKDAALKIQNYISSFDVIKGDFEKVYGQTRFLSNPEGYQLDSNMHEHLANAKNNMDWMYRFELDINKEIKAWLSKQ